jgi:hypothetical protein
MTTKWKRPERCGSAVLAIGLLLLLAAAPASAQHRGGDMMGMRQRMMGMSHDSTARAQLAVIHELIVNHERITRSVTNLADGIRTVTESDDSVLARRIKDHVVTMTARVVSSDDPGWPMESTALRTIYRNSAMVRTVVDSTAKGIVVLQTSTDSATVAALQEHAAEVTELVRGGMSAMHNAMMQRRGAMKPE